MTTEEGVTRGREVDLDWQGPPAFSQLRPATRTRSTQRPCECSVPTSVNSGPGIPGVGQQGERYRPEVSKLLYLPRGWSPSVALSITAFRDPGFKEGGASGSHLARQFNEPSKHSVEHSAPP